MPPTEPITTRTRQYDPAEIAEMYAQNATAGQFSFGLPDATFLGRIQEMDTARVIFAEYSKTIIGAAILTFPAMPDETSIVPWFAREDLAILSRIVVEEQMRGLGVADQLMRSAERTAGTLGAAGIACAVSGTSGDFLAALERRGFRPAAKFSSRPDGVVALHKPLAAAQAA